MDIHSTTEVVCEEHSQEEETDDSCIVDFIEIVPLVQDTVDSCSSEGFGGDWSAQVKQENLSVVKQEPDNVRVVLCLPFMISRQMEVEEVRQREHSGKT